MKTFFIIIFAICLIALAISANAQVQTSDDVKASFNTPSVTILSIDEVSADKQRTEAFDVVESPLVKKKSLIATLFIDEVSTDKQSTKAFDVVESRLVKRKVMIA